MKNKITSHIILCGLLSTASMTFGMEVVEAGDGKDKETSQSKSPRDRSLIPSPKQPGSNPSSPRSLSPTRQLPTVITQFYAGSTSEQKYYHVKKDGSLTNPKKQIVFHNTANHYEAKIIEADGQYSIITTHLIDNSSSHPLEEEQSPKATTLTEEQVQMCLTNLLSKYDGNVEMLAFDDQDNSYHISHEGLPQEDLKVVTEQYIEKIKQSNQQEEQPTESVEQPKVTDTTATTSTSNDPDKQEQKTLKSDATSKIDTKKTGANNTTTNRTPYVIGGVSLVALLAVLYYHHDKLSTFFSDLFNKISLSVQSISSTR